MAPNSSTSSLLANNGSAYSNGSYASSSITNTRNPPQRQHSYPSADAYRRRDHNAVPNESTTSHRDNSSADHYTEVHASTTGYTNYGPHYLPAYNSDTPRYEHELTFEDDQNATAASHNTPQTGHFERAPTHSHHHQNDQNDQSDQSDQTNGAHPLTTQRWSAENSPEERLRLGLPRYETEEQQRQAYQAAVDYESYQTH